jgi:hypothetical protein
MDHVSSAGGGGLLTTTTTNRINNLRNNIGSASPPSTDAYVVVTLGGHVNLTDQEEESGKEKQKRYQQKTKVCRRTLNPVWDEGKKKEKTYLLKFYSHLFDHYISRSSLLFDL